MKPRYRGIVRGIANSIRDQRLRPGDRLPPQRDLAHRLGIAIATVGRAYAELENQGLITSHVGRGAFVCDRRAETDSNTSPNPGSDPKSNTDTGSVREPAIDMLTYRVPVTGIVDLVAETLRDIATQNPTSILLDASPSQGTFSHREAMAEWLLGHGIVADPQRIVLTNGGQHATVAAISTVTHPGDVIATEDLTDPRMKSVAGYLDRHLAGVACDGDGMIPDALDALCRSRRIAAVFCTPRNQNPTNTTMPLARRAAIIEVAERHDLPIFESDIYGTLFDMPNTPIATLAPHRTHFISSLGRIAGPGMKVGCLVSPSDEVARSRLGVGMSTGSATRIAAEIASRWIRSGRIADLVAWQQEDARQRVDQLRRFELLSKAAAHPTSAHAWLTLPDPWRSEDFIESAAAHGVSITPTHSFVVGRVNVPHAVRLVIGGPATLAELERALQRLEWLLHTRPRPIGTPPT